MGEGNLGKLIVSIGADLTELAKGLTDAQGKVNDTAKKIADATTKISTGMAVAGGAIVAAFTGVVNSTTDYVEEISKVSERSGIAIETLSRLKFAAEMVDVSFESVSNGLRFLQKSMYEANQGSNTYLAAFRALGLTVKDSNGYLKSTDTMLMEIADSFQKSDDSIMKNRIAMELFGRGGAEMVRVLNLGSQGIRELYAEADRLGVTLTGDNYKAIQEYHNRWKELKAAMGGVQLSITNDVIPSFIAFIKQTQEVVAQIKIWVDKNKEIVDGLLKLGAAALVFGSASLAIVKVTQAVTALWAALNAIIPIMTSLAVIKAFAWTDSIVSISAAFGWWPATIAIIGAGLAGWGMEKLMEQIPGVSAFLDRIFGVAKENRPMRGGKVMSPDDEKKFMTEQGIGPGSVDMTGDNRIVVSKPKSALESNGGDAGFASDVERRKQLQQEYYDWEQRMRDGQVAQEADSSMTRISLLQQENNEKMGFVQLYNQTWETAHRSMYALATNLIQTLQTGLGTAISGIIMGTTKASEAFKQLGMTMVKAVVDFLVQQAIAWALSKMMQAAAMAIAGTMASALTVMWAPAAFLASVATLGGAVATGSGALMAGMGGAMSMAGSIAGGIAAGGAGGLAEGTDTVPAMLTPGEMVVPRSFSDAIRAGSLTLSGKSGGDSTTNNSQSSVTINFQATINNDMDMERAAEKLGLIMEQKLRGVR